MIPLKVIADMVADASAKMVAKHAELMPVVFYGTSEGTLSVMGVPQMGDPELKRACYAMIKTMAQEQRADWVALAIEAWQAAATPGLEGLPASKRNDRREILSIAVVARSGGQIFRTYAIERDGNNKRSLSKTFNELDDVEGPIFETFT